MAAIQAGSPVLTAVAGQAGAAGGTSPAGGGFFAEALANSLATSTPAATGNPGLAGQSLVLNLPAAFLPSPQGLPAALRLAMQQQAAIQASAQQATEPLAAEQQIVAASGQGNPLLAALSPQGKGVASGLFDKLATRLAALGAGDGDPKQVAAQLAALGLNNDGDLKQLAAKLTNLGEAGEGADAEPLKTLLGQLAQDLEAGRTPDPALLGALATQWAALQGGGAVGGKSAASAADIAAGRKELPAIAGPAKGEVPALAMSKPAAVLAGDADSAAGGGPAHEDIPAGLEFKALMGKEVGASINALDPALPTATAPVQSEGGVMRADGLPGAATAVMPKGGAEALPQEALSVRTPLRAPGWESDFAQKVVWMVGRESQSAQLVLNPPQMGTIEVRLTLAGGEAGAQFFSPHQGVREAIETAMPRLRDMMAEAGLSLGQASVSSESFRDQRANAERADQKPGIEPQGAAQLAAAGASSPVVQGRGLVDLYV